MADRPLVSRIGVPRRIGLDYISSEATNGSVGGEMLYERLEIWFQVFKTRFSNYCLARFLELGFVITVSLFLVLYSKYSLSF